MREIVNMARRHNWLQQLGHPGLLNCSTKPNRLIPTICVCDTTGRVYIVKLYTPNFETVEEMK
jgi:hypothetical protein